MTTEAQAALYEAQHVATYNGRPIHFYNPHNRPTAELLIIYGFNNGGSRGLLSAVLMAEDGTELGGHACSSEAYMLHDLGLLEGSRKDRQEEFRKHYPDGYRMEFVSYDDVPGHEGLMRAIRATEAKQEAAKREGGGA